MKPKDLKSPFKFEERRPLLQDGVFYLPEFYTGPHIELEWETSCIEFCSGNGDWIIERALRDPELRFVAVELRFDRVRKIWSKMRNRGVKNLLIVCGEAFTFSRHYIPDAGALEVYINFPDPWPKRKHAKHRLMQKPFLDEMARIVQGNFTFVTDDEVYMAQAEELLEAHPDFSGKVVRSLPGYGSSYFEELWREKGKEILYATYSRCVAEDQEDIHGVRAELSHCST
ncbi:MAG: tRNA (guanosine(46)-N7)-methyltransferase TrmB [Chlamydiales bacterium]|nr:tRNA (guanosine(46)-N7)-methyltransferase TrmB [Chlamydiales bacterium]